MNHVPDALYVISSRTDAARAVAACIVQSLPCGDAVRPIMAEINTLGDLGHAVESLLDTLKYDVEQLELDLKTRVTS